MHGITLRHGNENLAQRYHEPICRLYDLTFSAAPFTWTDTASSQHATMFAKLRQDPTFSIALALTNQNLIGFAYGYRLPTDHGWWDEFPQPLPAHLTNEWEGRTFALINLALHPHWRGQGIGQQIVSQLLNKREEERAILSVQPNAVEAQQIYRHLGWRKIGRKGPLTDAVTPYWDIYLHEISPTTNQTR